MARPREFDIDQVLDAAINTFWTKGYEATSMADLMEAMNLKKGSIYKAFEDKHDLFCKALERYLEGMDKQMREMVETATSPRAGIEKWLQKGVEMCQGQGVKRGCLALNTAVELGPHDCQVAEILKGHHKRMIRMLSETIARGQEQGQFRNNLAADQLAQMLLIFGAGMLTTSKAFSDEIDLEQQAEMALGLLT
ncbi:MAG: TetR/AcrR family transcriptional regulator [Candidatus Latescibacterota bacterium]|jgi:TetR/AcrR family transcriptional repressor of nem operon